VTGAGAAAHTKTISSFLPVSTVSLEECDRHYREVHTRFARRFMRETDDVVSYHINRATAEYDLVGDWRQRPRAFRFIVLRTVSGPLHMPPERAAVLAEDHRNFLRDLRNFPVEEQVVVDELRGQTALVKYLFEFDRRPDSDPAQARHALEGTLTALADEAGRALGLRLLLADHVQGEREAAPIDEPGQRPLPTFLPGTCKQAFLEFWFDQQEWAEEWFRRPAVRTALQDPAWALARGYRVDEECGLDRR
jgi:hypothetical protein